MKIRPLSAFYLESFLTASDSSTEQRYTVENSAQSRLARQNLKEGERQARHSHQLGAARASDTQFVSSLGELMKQEMDVIYSELPLTFLFERQLSGLFALRFRRVMQHMLTRWMHGYYLEALRRWRAFLAADFTVRQTEAAVLVQKTRRGHLARRRVRRLCEKRDVAREQARFDAMMNVRRRWLRATDVERVWRGYRGRNGDALKEARHRMRCIVLVQSRWRIKKSRFLALVLGARHKLRTIAAVKIQRIALGYAGRKRAKLRRKVRTMEEREALLGSREYVIAQGFRRHGAAVLLQRWIRHMHGGWCNPKFRGHELMVRVEKVWRGYMVRIGEELRELRTAAWLDWMCREGGEESGGTGSGGGNRAVAAPAARVLQTWWRGRAARRLLRVMLQAVKDHAEQLRKKKEEAFKANIVAAPGLLGKVRFASVVFVSARRLRCSSLHSFRQKSFVSLTEIISPAHSPDMRTHTCSHTHVLTRTRTLTRSRAHTHANTHARGAHLNKRWYHEL